MVVRSLLWLQNPHLAKAQILLARGTDADVRSALDILDVLLEGAERTFSVRSQIEVLSLRALALDRQGQDRRWARCVAEGGGTRAARRLRPGLRRSGITHADHAAPPCRGEALPCETIRRIVAAFPEPPKQGETSDSGSQMRAANAALVEPLSNRELEVLALFRERLSNQEIAKHAVHFHSDREASHGQPVRQARCQRRREAVIKAENLKILPPR